MRMLGRVFATTLILFFFSGSDSNSQLSGQGPKVRDIGIGPILPRSIPTGGSTGSRLRFDDFCNAADVSNDDLRAIIERLVADDAGARAVFETADASSSDKRRYRIKIIGLLLKTASR